MTLQEKLALPYVKLNLGGGQNYKQPLDEWIHHDGVAHPNVDIVCDWENMPLPDKCIDEIWTSDTIEHVPVYRQQFALREWNRILKIGGILSGSTPNLESAIRKYVNGIDTFDWLIQNLYGDRANPYQQHYILFTTETLNKLLMEYGFEEVDFSGSPGSKDPAEMWWLVFKTKKIKDV